VDLDILTQEFCAEMGWDPATGRPTRSKLAELGLT
jgi:aldehyde:ferredoxin oxidoreductase